jgi:hypothetical protein
MLINILFAWVVHDGGHDEDSADPEKHATSTVDTKTSQAVGYVQGMSFIAMNLLWHAGKEEAAFWVFAAMMQRYDLRQMFEPPDMRGLQMRTFTIAQLLQYTMPELSKHLAEYLHNSMGLVLTDWLLTLFSSSMALGPLAELWDRFFVDGYRCIYCLILARLRCLQPWLLREKDFTRLTHLIHFAHVNFDRVDGNLVPRLPGKPPSGEGCSAKPGGSSAEAAVLGAGGISSSRLTVLQRFVAGAATALGAAATLGGSAPRGHSRNGDSEEELPGIRKRQAAPFLPESSRVWSRYSMALSHHLHFLDGRRGLGRRNCSHLPQVAWHRRARKSHSRLHSLHFQRQRKEYESHPPHRIQEKHRRIQMRTMA